MEHPKDGEAFAALASLGVRTVVSVDGARPNVDLARKLGIRYIHLPIGYDGVSHARALDLAKAISSIPDGIYVHCHHGRHRAPAATAVACVALRIMNRRQAKMFLKEAGTSPRYTGLFRSIQDIDIVDGDSLERHHCVFKESVDVAPVAEHMVAIDRRMEQVIADLDSGSKQFSENAVLLHEHFVETLRSDEIKQWSPSHRRQLQNSAETAMQIVDSANDPRVSRGLIATLKSQCNRCHAEIRD